MASDGPDTNDVENQTQIQDPTEPFALEPEIFGENEFIFEKNLDVLSFAERLKSEIKYLLNILKTSQPKDVQERFQIELRKLDPNDKQCSIYKMSLCIDSVLWFKHHKLSNTNNTKDLEQLYEIGSRYIEKVKDEAEYYPNNNNTKEHDLRRVSITDPSGKVWCKTERQGILCMLQNASRRACQFTHYNWCPEENCNSTGECKTATSNGEHYQKFLHFSSIFNNINSPIYYQCHYVIATLNKKQLLCHYYVDPDLRIYVNKVEKATCYSYFIVSAKNDSIPVVTLNPIKHCENEEYVQTDDAWQAVLQTLIYIKDQLNLEKFPLNRLYIDFGKWIQQEGEDLTRSYCHAHINIVLTSQTIEKINESYQSKQILFPSLIGAINPVKIHRLDNSLKLVDYMKDNMPPLFIKRNRELRRSISALKDELQQINEHFRQIGTISKEGNQVSNGSNGGHHSFSRQNSEFKSIAE